MLYALIAILVLFITAFIVFMVYNHKMTAETFNKLSQKKVSRIAKRRNLNVITNAHLLNYQREKLGVNHIIFGNKYIYLITDLMLKGFVTGEANDNSWVYLNSIKRTTNYISNLNSFSDKNIQEFAGILGIKEDLIVSICLVPNECDFKVKGLESDRKLVVHYSSLNHRIRKLEQQEIDSLDKIQIYEQYETIKRRNDEGLTT